MVRFIYFGDFFAVGKMGGLPQNLMESSCATEARENKCLGMGRILMTPRANQMRVM
jgi:hypothetical protein